jgi:serine/threonine-protein kinase
MIGNTLSHYKIIEKLGQGGMGEVYLAEDSRLDRKVALKILPQHLSERAELRERFEREARAVSSLNHPHICTLHDIGEQDGIHYLVMEHLVGETLEARLAKGPLPLEQTLEYAIQIADALDKAHRQGVVHRDLKPGNIMLVKSGAKLLDFGLAKLQAAETPTNLSALPTEQANLTAEGTILGTLQYMAPEQLEAKEADSRTDIFAFGAVVYEMATGKKAFEGKSQASLIAAIMEKEPPAMAEIQPVTPPVLDWVVKRCLAKEPDERVQTAADLMAELRWVTEIGTQVGLSRSATAPALWKRAIPWSMATAVIVIATIFIWNSARPEQRLLTRFPLVLPPTQRLLGQLLHEVALSPDGTHLVYVANTGGSSQLYLRALDSLEAKPIEGTEGAAGPFFSPNGQWLGFFAGGRLKKVSISGGPPLILCDAQFGRGATWGPNDTIVFAPTRSSGLFQVSAAGGAPEVLNTLKGAPSHRYPEVLPGGKAVLFTVGTSGSWDNAQIVVQELETGQRRVLVEGGTSPRYAPTGHLVYARAGTLLAVPFDLERLEVSGATVPVIEGVVTEALGGKALFSFSRNGSLLYVPGASPEQPDRTLVWVDRQGLAGVLPASPRRYKYPRLSPDGGRLAVNIVGPESDVWLYDLSGETLTRLTFEGDNERPVWTPDGKRVTFASRRAGPFNLFWRSADGSGSDERLTTGEHFQNPESWSSDGRVLAFQEVNPTTNSDIWVLPLEGERQPRPFLRTPFNEADATFSPDGLWLAYASDESGQYKVYVQPFPGPGGKRQISTEGGREPVWNPNGRELFYRNGDKMIAVDISTEPAFRAGTPRLLFEAGYEGPGPGSDGANYDVSPDGQRFVMIQAGQEEQEPVTQINVVLNWFEELKRLVPTDN